jgi:V/A-type H+-transporting ATPase subunit E
MKELRGTENLEREILDDARKKAERILKNAGTQIQEIESEWTGRRTEAFAELEARYRERTENARREIESSVPLEMKRKELEYLDSRLREHLERYFRELGPDGIASIVSELLGRVRSVVDGKRAAVLYGGMSGTDAAGLVRACLPGCTVTGTEERTGITGIVLETDDGIRYTATTELVRKMLLDEKREELFEALFEGNG